MNIFRQKNDDFEFLYSEISKLDKYPLFNTILSKLSSCSDIYSCNIYKDANGKKWKVYNSMLASFKYTTNEDHSYNCFFCTETGATVRFGKTITEDPDICALGPEILDVEIVTGFCPQIKSKNCEFCYKNNTNKPGKCMLSRQYKTILDKFPNNLMQVALGVTGVKSNIALEKIISYTLSKLIVPNITISGADLDKEHAELIASSCGACAVSCYEGAKDVCYNAIHMLDNARNNAYGLNDTKVSQLFKTNHLAMLKSMKQINMHLVLADFSIGHVLDVLNDISKDNNYIAACLSSVVFLRAKPVGRAKDLDCTLSRENLEKVIDFCFSKLSNSTVKFGFDSCCCKSVQDIFKKSGKENLNVMLDQCESARMSAYVNVEGKMTPCSFVEHVYKNEAIDLLDNNIDFTKEWCNNKMLNEFRALQKQCRSCPIYDIDVR